MSETTYSIERDLNEAEAMAKGLETYVRGNNLYGSAGGGLFSSNMPSLTVGALLMRLRRLHALDGSLSDAQRAKLAQIDALHAASRREWTRHYDEKLSQEGLSRLKAMGTFFEECADRPQACAGIYLPEALRRTIVQEIVMSMDQMPESDAATAIRTETRSVDSRLRRYTQSSDFIWAKTLEDAYPRETFWWLYAKPPVNVIEKN